MEYRRGELARREVINVGKFRLKDLAQEKGLTQEELAQRSGVTISTVRRVWQNKGADDARVGTLRALAQVLGVTVDDLYNPKHQTASNELVDNRMSLVGAPA